MLKPHELDDPNIVGQTEEVVNHYTYGTPFKVKIRHAAGSPSKHAKIIIEPTGPIEMNYDQFLRLCTITIGTVDLSMVL